MSKPKNKNTVTARQLIEQYQVNCDRITSIADACEQEQRERTDSEEAEYRQLLRENQMLQMRMQALANPGQAAHRQPVGVQLREALRDAMDNGSRTPVTLALTREIQTSAALDGTGVIPVSEQEMLAPLRAGLIYDKVGITIRTGLVGSLRWPKHGKATAKFVGEAEKLTESKIDWDAITVAPKRLGVAIPVTRQELFNSEGVVESVIKAEMPQAVVDKINEALFATDKTGRVVYGPFATAGEAGGCEKLTFAAAIPTRKELLQMKAKVAKAGVDTSTCCFIMTETMKAELEDVSVDKGSGRFLCENDRIFGYPVFCTDAIGEGNIGFGDWGYQAAGFFGAMNLVVDPYSLSLEDSTRFVLNTDFATVTLVPGAFILGVAKNA
ncbi:MAG: phage major capsid protein [Muribaculaceae bacterium]|nr:phage major capsid protein [Muribaculaceae bacterium]